MTARNRRSTLAILALPTAALVAVLSFQAGASRAPGLAGAWRPVSVGTIDLGQVFEKVNERAERDAQLKALEESLQAEARVRQESINGKQATLREMAPGDARNALAEDVARELIEAEIWFKFKRAEVDRERALLWQDLYRRVKLEAERLAAAEGIDLVLVNDSLGELRTTGDANTSNEALVLQQISNRRVLFSQREIDLTERLIVRMNNTR